ncbi:TIGR02466 family protein [Acidisphaera sp. L21]|uniref:TIGR02466 family protein n=1 Tax=Acidisphaera sp. L21 TaxID=1641851 RepID=UPI00131A9772|nr:TIGR02466 family protein [Acidisphaera sp. L21]
MFDACIQPGSFGVGGLFPTPLVNAELVGHETINATLAPLILARQTIERGVTVSNVDGWHSVEFQSWCGPAGEAVLQAARQIVDRMTLIEMGDELLPADITWRLSAWANVSIAGEGNRPHGHPGAFWSGIYWVDDGGVAENPAAGGLLELADPRGVMPEMHAPHLRFAVKDCLSAGRGEVITPQAGRMIMFPSWLIHSVTRFHGGRPRISIAFNFSA